MFLNSCGIYRPVDAREFPPEPEKRIQRNIEEGRGLRIGTSLTMGQGGSGGNFQFASTNALWRATLETLDFLPLTTVDYSGGMIITDWYTDANTTDESLKFTIRFLSNEVQSNSLKVIVHKKECASFNNCNTTLLPETSKIKMELLSVILKIIYLFSFSLRSRSI